MDKVDKCSQCVYYVKGQRERERESMCSHVLLRTCLHAPMCLRERERERERERQRERQGWRESDGEQVLLLCLKPFVYESYLFLMLRFMIWHTLGKGPANCFVVV